MGSSPGGGVDSGSGGGNTGGSGDTDSSSSGSGSSSASESSSTGGSSSTGNGGRSESDNSDRSDNENGFDRSVADVAAVQSGVDPSDDDDDSQTTANDNENGASPGAASVDEGLTADQSRSLAESAAVMDGYAFSPPDIGPAANDEVEEEEGVVERAVDAVVGTAALTGGVVVGAAETVTDAAIETVSMVNDAAGTVLDAAIGWTGIDVFEGHAERNAARGQAIIDAVTSPVETAQAVASSVEEGWETFEENWENERYFDAGRQIGGVGVEVAAVAVPASKVATVGRVGRVDDLATVNRYNELDAQGHAVSRHGAHVTEQMLEDRAVHGIDPITGTRVDGVRSTPTNTIEHTAPRTATSVTSVDAFVTAERNIRSSQQYRDARDAAIVDGRTDFRVDVPLDDVLGPNHVDHVQGVTRVGSAKNPQGSVPADLTNGNMRGVFEFNSGTEPGLVTMHPVRN